MGVQEPVRADEVFDSNNGDRDVSNLGTMGVVSWGHHWRQTTMRNSMKQMQRSQMTKKSCSRPGDARGADAQGNTMIIVFLINFYVCT